MRNPTPATTTAPTTSASRASACHAFSIDEGDLLPAGTIAQWGTQQAEEYVAKHYHQPSDEYRPEMDFRGDAVMARFGIALGWEAANQSTLVGWKAGDEFEKAREASGSQ